MTILNISTGLIIAGAVVLGLVVISLLVWRSRSTQHLTKPPPAPSSSKTPGSTPDPANISSPRYQDLIPGEFTKGSYSSQVQTDHYNLRVESINGQTRYVVNGVAYKNLEEIPKASMRRVARQLLNKTFKARPAGGSDEILRQVITGNQATIELKSADSNISIQRQGKNTRYIVNGMTYYHLNEIPDPDMKRKAKDLLGKML